jgi:hypothetical protein
MTFEAGNHHITAPTHRRANIEFENLTLESFGNMLFEHGIEVIRNGHFDRPESRAVALVIRGIHVLELG